MHRVPFPARALAILVVGLMLPVTLVRAQTPPASPTAEKQCTPGDVDPTQLDDGNNITFVRLSGPPAGATEGPSLYRVIFGAPQSWYLGGCELEQVAINVSSGPLLLRTFSGTTDIYYAGDSPSPDCTTIDEKPEHETRNVCELAPNGKPATLQTGDAVFHDDKATYKYATNEELLGLNSEPAPANARSAGPQTRRTNATVGNQPGGDQSIDIASGRVKPYGCGGECH